MFNPLADGIFVFFSDQSGEIMARSAGARKCEQVGRKTGTGPETRWGMAGINENVAEEK